MLFASGFLGTRGSFMLDVVVIAMAAILPALGGSIYLVRCRRAFAWHRRIQLTLAGLLLGVVGAFELEMRLMTDWTALATPSPYYSPSPWNAVTLSLAIHLVFAVPTLILWGFVVVQALRRFGWSAQPGSYGRRHAFWAWLATVGMVMTAVTGWLFYWLAFVATA